MRTRNLEVRQRLIALLRRRPVRAADLARQLDVLRARGVEAVRLHTVAEFPTQAVDLYRALGFETVKVFPRYRKPSAVLS